MNILSMDVTAALLRVKYGRSSTALHLFHLYLVLNKLFRRLSQTRQKKEKNNLEIHIQTRRVKVKC